MGIAGFEQVPRYRELAYRVFGEDIDFLPPGIELEQDRDEWALWKREILWIAFASIAAGGAGNFSHAQLFNPPPAPGDPQGEQVPGSICLLDAIHIQTVAATAVQVKINNSQISSSFGAHAQRDSRVRAFNGVINAKAGPSMRVANGVAVVPGTTVWQQSVVAASSEQLDLPRFIISPGNGVIVHPTTANEIFVAAFVFRTRPLRPEELS